MSKRHFVEYDISSKCVAIRIKMSKYVLSKLFSSKLFSFSFSYHLIPGDSYLHTSSKYVTYRSLE